MTTKHYKMIASVFADCAAVLPPRSDTQYTALQRSTYREVAQALAVAFAKDNFRFNRDLFLSACGVIE